MREKLIAAENLRVSSVVKRLVDGSEVAIEAFGDVKRKLRTFDDDFISFEDCQLLNRSLNKLQSFV
jgi:hypothetical protein